MTIEDQCYVCGKEVLCINGLCPECTMKEFWNPGAAFAATFGSLDYPEAKPDEPTDEDDEHVGGGGA